MYPAPQCGHLKPMSCPNWPPIVALYAIRWLQRRRRALLRPSQQPPAKRPSKLSKLESPASAVPFRWSVGLCFSLARLFLFGCSDLGPLLVCGCCLRRLIGLAGVLHVVRGRLDLARHETVNPLGP